MTLMDLLPEEALQAELHRLPGWRLEGKALVREYDCKSFGRAVALVVRAALMAERSDHHPDMLIQYSKVTFTLTSHDRGGVTGRDLKLARALDEAAQA